MNKLSHVCGLMLLVVLGCSLATQQLMAQESVNFYVESIEVSINEEVAIDVTTENFTNIAGLEFSLQWDPSLLEFTGVENVVFDGSLMGNFNQSQLDSGRIGYLLSDMTLNGLDLEDGARLFTLKYNITGPDNSVYTIDFGNEPNSPVVADTTNATLDTNFTGGTVTVGNPNSVSSAFESDPRLRVSPNPFSDRAQLVVKELGSGPAQLKIFDIDGRLVLNRSVVLSGQPQTFNIEAGDLKVSGLYLLQISTDRGKYSRKLIFRGSGR